MTTTLAQERNLDALSFKSVLLITSTFTVMAGATVAPALPAMQKFFIDVDNVDFLVRLVLTLPALFIAVMAPLAGYFADRFGRKPLLVASMILYAAAGSSGFVLDSLYLILVGRAFLGIAVGGLMTSVTTLITDYYDGEARANFLGIQSGFMGFGGTIFLTLGGVLADFDWRAVFLIYLTSLLVVPFIVSILYEPFRSKVSGSSGDVPLEKVPFGTLAFGYFNIVFIQTIFYAVPLQLPFYLEELFDASASMSGIAIAVLAGAFALTAGSFGWFLHRFGHIPLLVGGLFITAASYEMIGLASDWILIALALPVTGFGIGLIMPNMTVWLANAAPTALRGRVLGGSTTSVFLGQFIAPFVTQPILNATSIADMYVILGIATAVLAVIVLVRRPRQRLTE